jgi:GT2 family glycosyltransferase
MTNLSVVIPATDRPASLDRAVAAARRASRPSDELIVVDRPRNSGPAAARNRGAAEATGDVLVFVDADVEVHADAFDRIRAAFDEAPDLVGLFGSYDDTPEPGGVISDFRNLLHHYVHQDGAGAATTFWAGLGAVRRELFIRAGGFDEARFHEPSVEDIELGMRLHAAGARLLLDPSIQGKHLKRWTLRRMLATDLSRRGVPWLRLILERRSATTALNLAWPQRVGAIASLILVGASVRRNRGLAAASLALLLALDREFYALLMRRGGLRLALAGVPLHVAHRLTAAAAVPIALTAVVVRRR